MARGTERGHAPAAGQRAARARPPLSLSIQCGDGIDAPPASRAQLRRWIGAALDGACAFTLRFVGEAEGRALNAQFRGRDYATNVLTFDYDDPEVATADIVVCLPVVEREAREQRKPPAAHLAHLIVHGALHAQGYDHEDDDDAAWMESRERAILARFGIDDPYRDEPSRTGEDAARDASAPGR